MIFPALLLAVATSQATASDPLTAAAAAAQRAGAPTWLSWSVPSAIEGNACCWNSRESSHSRTCSLSGENYGMNMSHDAGMPIDSTVAIYARLDGSGVDRLRAYSSSCRVDREGERVQEVSNVTAAQSVAWLEALTKGGDGGRASKRRSDGAVSAIALHDDHSADPVLERIARTGDTKQTRHAAAFWLGNTRAEGTRPWSDCAASTMRPSASTSPSRSPKARPKRPRPL